MLKCPICKKETRLKRVIGEGGEILKDYICENCYIGWYIPESGGAPKIRVSTTHSIAQKLSDEEFKKLLERIRKYEESQK
jgi:hypothetical protein